MQELHINLKILRESLGFTQKEFGSILGLSDSAIMMYERGHRNPKESTLEFLKNKFSQQLKELNIVLIKSDKNIIEEESETENMKIGKRIEKVRISKNLTASQLAERAYLSASAISRIESGEHVPRLSSLKKIASALKIDLERLIPEDSDLFAKEIIIEKIEKIDLTEEQKEHIKNILDNKLATTIHEEESQDLSFTESFVETVVSFYDLLECVTKEWDELYETIRLIDQEIVDLQHEIELIDFDEKTGYELALKMKEAKIRRRKHKDYQEIIRPIKEDLVDKKRINIIPLYKAIEKMRKQMEYQSDRIYKPRVRTDIKLHQIYQEAQETNHE